MHVLSNRFKKILLFVANLCNLQNFCNYICAHGFDLSTRYTMPIIVSNCQHCDEQEFQTLSCVHYTIFAVVKLGLFIRAHCYWIAFLHWKKTRVRLAYIL